ncbi:MAG: trehalose-6-phosphate synthase, partial [Flavobacteriaceae bacterium]
MFKNIIVSNRLPIKITKINGSFDFKPSTGGLATGLSSIHKNNKSLWVGWTGQSSETINDEENNYINQNLKKLKLSQIRLNSEEINDFYFGMSNKCLWPLFHYFIEFSIFESNMWDAYKKINEKFCDHIVSKIDKGGTVWIHDYQLLLLPKMIKEIRPDVTIGFFLHIPFPSFEIFRIFPWRIELLEGMLGSDLIGFHTFDYQRHFLSSVKRILMYDVLFNKVILGTREIIVNTFPMGIDFNKFFNAAKAHQKRIKSEKTELKKQLELHKKNTEDSKLILSIDRLDYTKGVINRLKSFEIFLNKYPQYLEKVRLLMLTVPSRSDVPEYKRLKKETDELVGRINGNYATVNWTPIWYYYR